MSLCEVFLREAPKKRGAQDNCLIRLTQYPPLNNTLPFLVLLVNKYYCKKANFKSTKS